MEECRAETVALFRMFIIPWASYLSISHVPPSVASEQKILDIFNVRAPPY